MTRAPEATGKPLLRTVTGPDGRDAELVAADHDAGGHAPAQAAVFVPWGAIYRRGLIDAASTSARGSPPRRRVARGLLAAERR